MVAPNFRMPFPRVPITFYLAQKTDRDAFGNVNVTYSDDATAETLGSYAPSEPKDDIEEGRPHGATVRLRLYLPKTFDADIRDARVRISSGDSVIDAREYIVVGEPASYMRDATPGDMSWYVEVADYVG